MYLIIIHAKATPITDKTNRRSMTKLDSPEFKIEFAYIISDLFLKDMILNKFIIISGLIVSKTPKKLRISPTISLEVIFSFRKITLITKTNIGAIY